MKTSTSVDGERTAAGVQSSQRIAFVDTNVLVYAFDETDPERQQTASALVLELARTDQIRLSTQILQEFFVTMTRKVGKSWDADRTLEVLEDFATWPVVQIDFSLIRGAVHLLKEASLSFWDALVLAAAMRAGASVLYTEDLNHGQVIQGVTVLNPFLPIRASRKAGRKKVAQPG